MLLNIIINSIKNKGAYFILLSLIFIQFFSIPARAVSIWTTLPPSLSYSARILYDQGVDYGWTRESDTSSSFEEHSLGVGGAGGTLQGGIIFNIFPRMTFFDGPGLALEFFAETSAFYTSYSPVYYAGAATAFRVSHTGIYAGYGYSHQRGDFARDGVEEKLKPGRVGVIGFFIDYPVTGRTGFYLGVHLFDQDPFSDDQAEYWDRLSVRAGLSYHR